MVKILITGVAGFIGSHVARRFKLEGFTVIGVDDLSSGRLENVPHGITFIQADLSDKSSFSLIPSDCEKILHLAGQSSGEISFDDPISDLEKNTTSTLNLIHYGVTNKVERMVYASSMSVYGTVGDTPIKESDNCEPLSCYGVGKLAAEGYLRVYRQQLPSVILRMFNVYGPGQDMENLRQGMVSIYLAQALKSGIIEVKGSVDRFRDFIFIDDVVEAWYRAAIYRSAIGKTLNIATGIKTSVKDLLDMICSEIEGSEYRVGEATLGDQSGIYGDIAGFKQYLGLQSLTPIDRGLKIFIDWAR